MTRRRLPLPAEPRHARIERLDDEQRGVATVDSRLVRIPGALPGELVAFSYVRRARRSDDGRIERVLDASTERVPAACAHFATCGGCRSQHVAHPRQVAAAEGALLDTLAGRGVSPRRVEPPVLDVPWGYRRRARLGARHVPRKGGVLVGFREKNGRYVAEMSACEILEPVVGRRIDRMRALLSRLSIAAAIPQIEVAVGEDGAALVFRHLEPPTPADLAVLGEFGAETGLRIFLQPGGLDTVQGLDPGMPAELSYRLDAYDVAISFRPTDFVQVNARVNRALVDRVAAWLEPRAGERILDLYCGLGNFTLPLARREADVLGVEGAPGLVARARANAARNRLPDARFEARDLSGAAAVETSLGWGPDKLLLDPPRSGAEALAVALARPGPGRPSRIVYVGCSPETFSRDAGALVHGGYELTDVGVVDMFPHTGHVETIGRFELR